MNRVNRETVVYRAKQTARNVGQKAAAVGAGALASFSAFAQDSLGTTAKTAIDGAKGDVSLVQGAIIGVVVLLVVFMFIRRSMGK